MKFFSKHTIKFLTICVLLVSATVSLSAQTTYYSKASGNANDVATWGINVDGSGASPADFVTGDIFIVRNGSTLTTSGTWNIDDAGVDNAGILRIANGGMLTASHAVSFTSSSGTGTLFEIENNGTYRHALSTNINSTILTATNLSFLTGSNFEMRTTGTHTNGAGAVFSNFTVTNNATVTFSSTVVYIADMLTISNGATLRFSTTGITSYLSDGGAMSTSGTGLLRTSSTSTNNLPAGISWSFQVNYDGTTAQRIQPGTYSTLNASNGNRTIISGATVTISGTFTPGSGTYTLTGSTIEYSGNGSANIPNLAYNNLTISGTGTKSLTTDLTVSGILSITNSSGFLSINGNTLTLNGTTDVSNGRFIGSSTSKLTVSGSTASTTNIKFSQSGTENQLHTFTLNRTGGGGATLQSQVDIINTLLLTNGILTTNNNTLALRSTSISNTARVDAVGSGASITYSSIGGIRAERFIPSGFRSFKDLSAGVYTFNNYIFENWQEAGGSSANLGTHITGVAGSAGVDATTGLDKTQLGNVSMYTYNGTTYPSITNTKTTRLDPYRGYRTLIRGDRNVDLWQAPTPTTMNTSTVLRATGQLIYGDVTYSTSGVSNGVYSSSYTLNSSSATGFSLIANPYWAPISWGKILDNVGTSNIQSTYWYFDPTLGINGVYATWLRTGGGGSETGTSNGVGNTNNFIQPGQAIFIRNNSSTSPAVKITESNKNISSSATNVFNTGNTTPLNKLGIILMRNVTGRGHVVFDGSTMLFGENNSNAVITNEDAGKITNGNENMAIVNTTNGTTLLSIESRKPAAATDTINLRLWQMTNNEPYTLNLIPKEFNANTNLAFLKDKFTASERFIRNDLDTIKHSFTISTNDSSSYFNRFSIIFKKPFTLPTTNTSVSLKGNLVSTIANLSWTVNNNNAAADILFYDIEKSSNAVEYTVLKRIYTDSSNTLTSLVDSMATNPKNYYRIKTYRKDAAFWNSNTILLETADSIKTIAYYPNPVTNNNVNIQFNKMNPGNYQFTLLDMKGNTMLTQIVQHTGNTSTQNIRFNKNIAPGIYKTVLLQVDTKKRYSGTIIVSTN